MPERHRSASERMCSKIGAFAVLALLPSIAFDPARFSVQTPGRSPDIFFSPTRYVVADAMLRLANVTADDVVYDLGSGDGRILVLAAQKYGARGVGIEIDPRLVSMARQNAVEGGVADKVSFLEGDLFAANISNATVVTLYLSSSINRQLEPKLKQELRPGARIVSHQFRIGSWTPHDHRVVEDADLYLWTVPAR